MHKQMNAMATGDMLVPSNVAVNQLVQCMVWSNCMHELV